MGERSRRLDHRHGMNVIDLALAVSPVPEGRYQSSDINPLWLRGCVCIRGKTMRLMRCKVEPHNLGGDNEGWRPILANWDMEIMN